MDLWWERWPGRLEYEKQRLTEAGIKWKEDAAMRDRGIIALDLDLEMNGNRLGLRAIFPDLYPLFRFEVFAPELSLTRHQHAFRKNLCFIGRSLENWRPCDTLAAFLTERLPLVLKAATDPGAAEDVEEHYGEPFSEYYTYPPRAIVLVDTPFWCLEGGIDRGRLKLTIDGAVPTFGPKGIPVLRAGVVHARNPTGRIVGRAQIDYERVFANAENGRARCVRIEAPITESAPESYRRVLCEQRPELGEPDWFVVGRWRFDIVGVTFPEEVQWRKKGDGWVFIVRFRDSTGREEGSYLVRAAKSGIEHRMTRTPELRGLERKVVAVVGLGCIGAPSVLELARAGVGKLHLLDFDIVDAETTSRWPLGLGAAGELKTDALKGFLGSHYPGTTVQVWNRRLGDVREDALEQSDLAVLDELLAGVDLLFDATAELPIQQVLADAARFRGIPYVGIWTTQGGWGGAAVRVRPRRDDPCWLCLQHHLNDRTIPLPPQDEAEMVQPEGCANPTFTACAFDTTNVALAGVRLAVSTMREAPGPSYPTLTDDVAILELRDHEGNAILPRWRGFRLKKHPECECHAR